jgi:FixJ family two-component response regulator
MRDIDRIAHIVDDIESSRRLLERVLESVGIATRSHASGGAFLEFFDEDTPGCVLLDIRMPGMNGLELQRKIKEMGAVQPCILVTAHGDVPIAVQAMKDGAFEFVEKPVRAHDVIDIVNGAFRHCDRLMAERRERVAFEASFDSLSQREREVMAAMVNGRLNKQIAHDLGISQRTVEVHRANVMAKMAGETLAELVRLAVRYAPDLIQAQSFQENEQMKIR